MRIEYDKYIYVEDTKDCLVRNGNYVKCGCGKSNLKLERYIDEVDFFESEYSCSCGNSIVLHKKRNGENWQPKRGVLK